MTQAIRGSPGAVFLPRMPQNCGRTQLSLRLWFRSLSELERSSFSYGHRCHPPVRVYQRAVNCDLTPR
jgi:hypothetical protein